MSDWLKGEELRDWLERTGILTDIRAQLGRHDERCVQHWRAGAAVHVYTADRILCKLGVCLGELPDSMYREPPRRSPSKRFGDAEVAKLRQLLKTEKTNREIAEAVGCSARSVRKYRALEAAA